MIPFKTRSRGPLFAASVAALAALSGCATDGYYGGVDVGMGSGYYGGPGGYYGDPYYGPGGYPYGYGGYGGWYDDYYYPGNGYYVYDRGGKRHRWTDSQRAYWQNRSRDRDGDGRGNGGGNWNGRPPGNPNWSDNGNRPDRPPNPNWNGGQRPGGGTDGKGYYRRVPTDAQREAWSRSRGRDASPAQRPSQPPPAAVTPQGQPSGAAPAPPPRGRSQGGWTRGGRTRDN